MSLNDHIHQLSRDHLKTAPDGSLRHAPALLAELRNAVTPGNSGSAGGQSGPPIPINPEAVDMLTRYTSDAKADYTEMTGESWPGTLEALLQHFGGAMDDGEGIAQVVRHRGEQRGGQGKRVRRDVVRRGHGLLVVVQRVVDAHSCRRAP